ncbi:MAG: hypothetical protein RBT47_03460 [Anaerolineae bacterium]|jgi:hypothetical protein|nr:hypothetical protein [Anaerolineae bacterium]
METIHPLKQKLILILIPFLALLTLACSDLMFAISDVTHSLLDGAPIPSSMINTTADGQRSNLTPDIYGDYPSVEPGTTVKRTLVSGGVGQLQVGTIAEMVWTPPAGAGGVTFQNPQPVNPDGPPPFRWIDLLPGVQIDLTYTASSEPGEQTELLQVTAGGETETTEYGYDVTGPGASAIHAAASSRLHPTALQSTDIVTPWIAIMDVRLPMTLTQATCELLQSPYLYFAVRLPSVPHTPTASATVPFLDPADTTPIMNLYRNGYQQVVTNTLSLRLDRLGTLKQTLPTGDGESWTAFGATTVKPCPTELNTADWKVQLIFYLDRSTVPAGRYPAYVCMDGAPAGPGGQPPQACSGPYDFTLKDPFAPPPFSLGLAGTAVVITPTHALRFPHALQKHAAGPVTVTLENLTTLGNEPWQMYHNVGGFGSDVTEPDFTRPITPGVAFALPDNTSFPSYIWLVQPTITPPTAAPGQYGTVLTATQVVTTGTPWAATARDVFLIDPFEMDFPAPPPCTALNGLSLQSTHYPSAHGHTFEVTASVTPLTATLPVSYTFMADGQTTTTYYYGAATQKATLTWATAGTYTLTVVARACGQAEPLTKTLQVTATGGTKIFLPLVVRN